MIINLKIYFNKKSSYWHVSDQEWVKNRLLLRQEFLEEGLPISLAELDILRQEALEQNKKPVEIHESDLHNHIFSERFDGFYSVKPNGVFFLKTGDCTGLKICGYLAVTEEFFTERDETGIGLTWKNKSSGKQMFRYFFNDEILDVKELTKELSKFGLDIPVQTTRDRLYLADYIKSCCPEKRSIKVSKPGWVSLGKRFAYVRPGMVIGNSKIPMIAPEDLKHSFKPKGTLSDWQEKIGRPALSSSRAVFACATVLASTCVKFMGQARLKVGFNFVGSSTSGKTLAMKIGLSVAGNPENLTETWWGNNNGLSALVQEYNDFVCALDEMSTLSKKEEAVEIAYILLSGMGKNRSTPEGTRLNKSEWNVMLLSTGEEGLSTLAKKAGKEINTGAELRMLDIPLPSSTKFGVNEYLPIEFKSIQDYAYHINEQIHQNYGVVLQVFLNYLCARLNDSKHPDFAEYLKYTIDRYAKRFVEKYAKGKTSQVRQAAYSFGFVAAVGDLACSGSDGFLCKESMLGWDCSKADTPGAVEKAASACFNDWLEQFEADKASGDFAIDSEDDKETQRILRRTFELFGSKIASFADANLDKDIFTRIYRGRDLLGYYEDVQIKTDVSSNLIPQRIFYLTAEAFDKYIVGNSNKREVVKVLTSKKIIDGKSFIKRVKCVNSPVRVWKFLPNEHA